MLIVGAHTRLAVLHTAMMRQTYATSQPLILRVHTFIAALTHYATSQSDVSRHLLDGGLAC